MERSKEWRERQAGLREAELKPYTSPVKDDDVNMVRCCSHVLKDIKFSLIFLIATIAYHPNTMN